MSTWAAYTGTHIGHAASAAERAASGPGNQNAAMHTVAQRMNESCGWFSAKMKAVIPLLLRGQCLGQAVGLSGKGPAAGEEQAMKTCVWGGSAMIFVKRKVGVCLSLFFSAVFCVHVRLILCCA